MTPFTDRPFINGFWERWTKTKLKNYVFFCSLSSHIPEWTSKQRTIRANDVSTLHQTPVRRSNKIHLSYYTLRVQASAVRDSACHAPSALQFGSNSINGAFDNGCAAAVCLYAHLATTRTTPIVTPLKFE